MTVVQFQHTRVRYPNPARGYPWFPLAITGPANSSGELNSLTVVQFQHTRGSCTVSARPLSKILKNVGRCLPEHPLGPFNIIKGERGASGYPSLS